MGAFSCVRRWGVVALLCVLVVTTSGCSIFGPTRPGRYFTYRVRPGDTLYQIGQRYGVAVKDLRRFNEISDPRALRVGQELMIPYPTQGLRGARLGERPTTGRDKLTGPPTDMPSPASGSVKTVSISSAKRYVGNLVWPVLGSRLVSKFGRRWFSFHEGIDLATPEGTPIVAAHKGQVVYSGDGLHGYGNLVIVKGEGLLTVYGHNRVNLVRVGDYVAPGEKIAEVGETGKASGPHLHFETRIKDANGKNVAVDPLAFYR